MIKKGDSEYVVVVSGSKDTGTDVWQKVVYLEFKVHTFWEGHKILQNLHLTFECMYCSQKLGEDFAKFCGLLRIYEL